MNEKQKLMVLRLFEEMGDAGAIELAISFGFNHPKLDELLKYNSKVGWSDNFEEEEYEKYSKLKKEIFKEVFSIKE